MAPLAERFVRIRYTTAGFERDVKAQSGKAGSLAGREFAKAFQVAAKRALAGSDFKVKVTPDLAGFKNLPRQAPIKVPMVPDDEPLKRTPKTRVPKVPVELDPLVSAFQADLRKQMATLAKQVSARIPVTPETAELRQDLAEKIRTVTNQLKVKIPAGPDSRTFETDLRLLAREVESQVRLSLPVEPQGAAEAGREAARQAQRAAGRIRLDVDRSNLSGINTAIQSFAALTASVGLQGLSRGLQLLTGSAGNAGTAITNLSTSLTAWIPFLVAGAVALSVLPAILGTVTAAVYALAGAIASMPALTAGLGASIGVLGLGFAGLADHFKQAAGGGGGAAKSMAGLRAATRAVTHAQRDLAKATIAVNRARDEELERIEDLSRAHRRAKLDVEQAEVALNAARRGTDSLAIQSAILDVEEAQDRYADLSKEKAKADKVGVEGSDAVQDALERQRDAIEALTEAQIALKEAQQRAGGGGAGKELMKLAPAAQEFVNTIKALKPAFEDLRLSVQQRLFAGVAGEVRELARVWLPQLKTSLGDYADTFNSVFRTFSATAREPEFIRNMAAGLESVRGLIHKVGQAVAGPLTRAFGVLARAADPFIDALGDRLTGLIERFARNVERMDQDGRLAKFFDRATRALNDLWSIGGSVLGIIGSLFSIFTGSAAGKASDNVFETMRNSLERLDKWLKDPDNRKRVMEFVDTFTEGFRLITEALKWFSDPENQKKIREWLDRLGELVARVDEWIRKIERWATILRTALAIASGGFGGLSGAANGAINSVMGTLGRLPGMVVSLGPRIAAAASGLGAGIVAPFRNAFNTVIGMWNRLQFNVPSAHIPGVGRIGGGSIGVTKIPFLASGGVVQARPGGTIANIGEGGEDEAVLPLSKLDAMLQAAAGGGGDTYIFIDGQAVDSAFMRVMKRNPDAVAKAGRAGNRRLGFAG